MIFPEHCKYVAVFDSDDHDLSKIYFLTKYAIFLNNNSCDVYKIETKGTGFIRDVLAKEKISSEHETVIYEKEVDLTNRTLLIEKSINICDSKINTVVFRGVDKHITFVKEPDVSKITKIEVFDIIPPDNPWLWHIIDRLQKDGVFGELEISFSKRILDLRQFEDPDGFVIFPCKTSGLNGYFLDSISNINDKSDVKLVGCEVSKKTFEEVFFPKKYEFINICPRKQSFNKPFIVRCCQKEKSGIVTIDGVIGVSVHWGATPLEIIDAVRLLKSKL